MEMLEYVQLKPYWVILTVVVSTRLGMLVPDAVELVETAMCHNCELVQTALLPLLCSNYRWTGSLDAGEGDVPLLVRNLLPMPAQFGGL